MNKKLQTLLKKNGKSIYGLTKVLDISPQSAEYLVKQKDLSKDYNTLKAVAEYAGADSIEDIID